LLSFANLEQADLSSAKLGEANLTGANSERGHPAGADLKKADLRGAYLTGAVLRVWNSMGRTWRARTCGCFRNHGGAGLFRFARARGVDGPGFGGGSSTALRIFSVAHNQQIRTKRVVAVSGYMKAQNARTSRRTPP